MPVVHTEIFKVRHYECDSYGHVNNAVYLRYMQEAGIGAAAVLGQDQHTLEAMSRTWLPRFTEIEVKTWVSVFRRVISRRIYEFRKQDQDDVIARGYTDWVFLDRDRLRPVTIPMEIKSLFIPEVANQIMSPRYLFPEPAPPPEGVFRVVRRVEWQDIDMMQHLNNAAYLDYVMDAGVQLTSAFGWPMSYWLEEGIAFVTRRNSIEYLLPAYLDDSLEITTWLFNVRPATVTRQFEVRRVGTDDLLARIQTLWVMVDLKSGRPMRIPDSMISILASNISGEK
jgi:acyl-CoA thioester hydrolase